MRLPCPFRLSGLAKKQESIITAPNYRRLIRFSWKGLTDESEFGCDPVNPNHNYLESMPVDTHWVRELDVTPLLTPDMPDDLASPIVPVLVANKVACLLVELPDEECLLYRPRSHVLVFDPKLPSTEQVRECQINELTPGDYLITHDAKAGFGRTSLNPTNAPLAQVWKTALKEIYSSSPSICTQRMKAAGIELKNLYQAAEQWIEMGDTTITAPKRKHHFKALINEVLGKGIIPQSNKWLGWQEAWFEVEKSRDKAIRHGLIKHSLINEQIVEVLRKSLPKLSELTKSEKYKEDFAADTGLSGEVYFRKIISMHDNYAAPDDQLEKPIGLALAEQYFDPERGHIS